ncbi:RelA/SpoT domain-containing protein [Vibrio sp. Isolate31]|uniref:RelA/SpoT domain-containing protein n=1 Tax=Vibrio sp. Isolate31 TaxID=2908537 RepID=UPI001EFE7212|nr:RelA/SpoT domain-containing protein [Vibrio sp. Isolate31]MCG9599714.1 RelA/SpoT domain-containing protein [Vibrio sp. Isolate31]
MSQELLDKHSDILIAYKEKEDRVKHFHKNVIAFFENSKLSKTVHSIRHRRKDINHLVQKIERKNLEDSQKPIEDQKGPITAENFFERITDYAGVRVLHLYQSQLESIHKTIEQAIEEGEFFELAESPVAYVYDPEAKKYCESIGLKTADNDRYYTSIHYVLKPNSNSPITCEVQVRTIMEELWGEVDHTMNYPQPHEDDQCRENIKVLARLVGAGGSLADSIMKRYS